MHDVNKTLFENIPPELKRLDHWVCWNAGILDKVPKKPDGSPARKNNPNDFSAFDDCAASPLGGVGFVFTHGDLYIGIDLDGCRNPKTGEFEEWASRIMSSLGSYSEISPSETGVKIICRGHSPFAKGKNTKLDFENKFAKSPGIEIYSHGAYFTLTGDLVSEDLDTIQVVDTETLRTLHDALPTKKKAKPTLSANGMEHCSYGNDIKVERTRKYLSKFDSAVSGNDGHGQTFNAACKLIHGFDLTPEQAFPLLAEYSERCEPPWTEHEIQHKLEHADQREDEQGRTRGYLLTSSNGTELGSYATLHVESEARETWLEREPIPLRRSSASNVPDGVFTGWFGDYANDLAKASETPITLAGLLGLAVVSALAAKKFSVLVEPKSGYFEPVNIWVAAAMEPSNRKSFVASKLLSPIVIWQRERGKEAEDENKKIRSRNATTEARIKVLRRSAGKSEDVADRQAIQAEIEQLEAEVIDEVASPQIFTEDATPEAVSKLLQQHGERIAIVSDEGGNLTGHMQGRYTNESNLDVYLKSYSGSSVMVNRSGGPPIHLYHPLLTIGVSPQPESIRELAANKKFVGRGVLSRFIFALPESKVGMRTLEPHDISGTRAVAYERGLNYLLEIATETPYALRLDSDAYKVWKAFQRRVEKLMAPDGRLFDSNLKGWGGKVAGNAIRVAAILHIAETTPYAMPHDHQINIDCMNRAITLCETLIDDAVAVFDMATASSEKNRAEQLLDFIQRNECTELSVRDAHYRLRDRAAFDKADDVREAFTVLADHGFVRRMPSQEKVGRPPERFEVHVSVCERSQSRYAAQNPQNA